MKILFIILFLVGNAVAFVKDPIYDDLEGEALILALIQDSQLDLAKQEINSSDLKSKKRDTFHYIMGRWHYAKGEFAQSVRELQEIKAPSAIQERNLYLARNFYHLKKYQEASLLYDQKDIHSLMNDTDWVWLAKSYMIEKSPEKAWKSFAEALQKIPTYQVQSEFIDFLLKMKLVKEAFRQASHWLQQDSRQPTQYLNIAEMFHQASSEVEAEGILQLGAARFPLDIDLNLALSQVAFQKGLLRSAQEGFARAAEKDAKYFYHAAEMNRQLGSFERSQYFNNLIADPKEKLKQKIAIYVDTNKYALMASMDAVLQTSELRQDDEVRYALAYSLARIGQVQKPLEYLARITKPELQEKSALLRKTIMDCESKGANCRL